MKEILKKAWFKPRRGGWRIREAKDITVEVGEGQTDTQEGPRRWMRKRETLRQKQKKQEIVGLCKIDSLECIVYF